MHMRSGWRRLLVALPWGLGLVFAALPAASAQKAAADWTAKLEPRTRAMEVCNLAGLTTFGKDKTLKPRPDRVRVNAGVDPKIEGALVAGSNGAVRSGRKWYTFSFKCTLNDTKTKATAFTYELGKEIPKNQLERLGLWE